MPDSSSSLPAPSVPLTKFDDPDVTATGEPRATVSLTLLATLWLNTGSLCNIACDNCYIESSPTNDRLAYLSAAEARSYLDEIEALGMDVSEIGFTGGEPFMNPEFTEMLEETLARGFRALVLTNAMKPLHHRRSRLVDLQRRYGEGLTLRVSMDHYTSEGHEQVRGAGTWAPMLEGLRWLAAEGFDVRVAGRTFWAEGVDSLRAGFGRLFTAEGVPIDAWQPDHLVLFPEMDTHSDAPEITTRCWDILGVSPESVMCASSRMVVKRKESDRPTVVPCTLLPYDPRFEMGSTLEEARGPVKLNHPFCAQFCVLGGASCSAA